MRRKVPIVVVLALLASCAATPIQREMQAAEAIKATNRAAITALDFGIITPEAGESVQALTRVATAELKRAVAERRSGVPIADWERVLNIVLDALAEASRIMSEEGAP